MGGSLFKNTCVKLVFEKIKTCNGFVYKRRQVVARILSAFTTAPLESLAARRSKDDGSVALGADVSHADAADAQHDDADVQRHKGGAADQQVGRDGRLGAQASTAAAAVGDRPDSEEEGGRDVSARQDMKGLTRPGFFFFLAPGGSTARVGLRDVRVAAFLRRYLAQPPWGHAQCAHREPRCEACLCLQSRTPARPTQCKPPFARRACTAGSDRASLSPIHTQPVMDLDNIPPPPPTHPPNPIPSVQRVHCQEGLT